MHVIYFGTRVKQTNCENEQTTMGLQGQNGETTAQRHEQGTILNAVAKRPKGRETKKEHI